MVNELCLCWVVNMAEQGYVELLCWVRFYGYVKYDR